MLTILDVGCRYGVFPKFKNIYEKFDYIGVDADEKEISRLNQKYEGKRIKFFSEFLSDKQKSLKFNISNHKGYSSGKKINHDSLWFGKLRKEENVIEKKINIRSIKSSDWILKNIKNKNKIIVKLDIEGGELDFLNGLNKSCFDRIEAFIVEAVFDKPYLTNSNFYTIGQFLSDKNYWLTSIDVENSLISKFCEEHDAIPCVSTVLFLKNVYKPINENKKWNFTEQMCDTLYALGLENMLLNALVKINPSKIKNFRLYDDYKYMIGHKFNRLKKSPNFTDNELATMYRKLFSDNLPLLSEFYQSDFFNKT